MTLGTLGQNKWPDWLYLLVQVVLQFIINSHVAKGIGYHWIMLYVGAVVILITDQFPND